MKKVLLIFALFVFSLCVMVSCRDQYNDDEEIQQTDKDDQERPGEQGGG